MYKCNLCERSFSRRANLTQHYNQLHPYSQSSWILDWVRNQKNENLLQQQSHQSLDNLDNNIWNDFDPTDIDTNKEDKETGDEENFSSKHTSDDQNLSSQILYFENEENTINEKENENIMEDNESNMEKESVRIMKENGNMEENESMEEEGSELSKDSDESISSARDIEDSCDGSFAAAIDDLNNNYNQEPITWPSQTYKEFMTNITRYHLSDAAGDAMLQILQKHCTEKLPASTRKGREYMDTMDIKGLHLKTRDLVEFEGKIYKLQYRPIIDAIKSLTSNRELCKDFFLDYREEWEVRDVSLNFFLKILLL